MKSYGQFCPVAKAAEVFCERWTALIIRDLAAGAQRFAELRRGVPLMSPTLLSHRLKQLEAEGILGKVVQLELTDAALAEERLDVAGPSLARRWLPGWFNLGPLAAVRSERAEAEPSPRGTRRSAH